MASMARELNEEELFWLRELCSEGRLKQWPPEHVVMELASRGLVLRRLGAIGATDAGRSAAQLRRIW